MSKGYGKEGLGQPQGGTNGYGKKGASPSTGTCGKGAAVVGRAGCAWVWGEDPWEAPSGQVVPR